MTEKFEFEVGVGGVRLLAESDNVFGPGGALGKAYLAAGGLCCLFFAPLVPKSRLMVSTN